MKFMSLIFFMSFLVLDANAIERRLLHSDFQSLLQAIEKDISIIEEGLKFGSRKETLELLYASRNRDLQQLPGLLLPWQQQVEFLSAENTELKRRLDQFGDETVCRVRLFGHEFIGLGANKDSARARAILLCSETYDYLLECSKARVVCP